jgi:hypothetical protein
MRGVTADAVGAISAKASRHASTSPSADFAFDMQASKTSP